MELHSKEKCARYLVRAIGNDSGALWLSRARQSRSTSGMKMPVASRKVPGSSLYSGPKMTRHSMPSPSIT